MLKKCSMVAILFVLLFSGCSAEEETTEQVKSNLMGKLPPQTQSRVDAEWQVYRSRNPEMDEQTARHEFDVIQTMSAVAYDADTAIWAERRAYAEAWLKKEIEGVYSRETVSDEFIQAAIDAYAFNSGTPELVTASHILIKPDEKSTAEERKNALEVVRKELMEKGIFTDGALSEAAQRLTRAGYVVDMNADLTFPKQVMQSFLGEQLSYMNVVEPFGNAAFALSAQNPLSEVTESEFGYHLILFKERKPERKADINRDREFLMQKILERGRTLAVQQKIEELMQSKEILVNYDRMIEISGADNQNNIAQ